MTIMRGGVDVTDEVTSAVKLLQETELRGDSVRDAIDYLFKAKGALFVTPLPWKNDAIKDGMDKIDAIISSLSLPYDPWGY